MGVGGGALRVVRQRRVLRVVSQGVGDRAASDGECAVDRGGVPGFKPGGRGGVPLPEGSHAAAGSRVSIRLSRPDRDDSGWHPGQNPTRRGCRARGIHRVDLTHASDGWSGLRVDRAMDGEAVAKEALNPVQFSSVQVRSGQVRAEVTNTLDLGVDFAASSGSGAGAHHLPQLHLAQLGRLVDVFAELFHATLELVAHGAESGSRLRGPQTFLGQSSLDGLALDGT